MTFIKYTEDGKVVIQPAALVLSGLEKEDVLEMHTLDNVLVLVKENMLPQEKVKTMCSLMRLVNGLSVDLMCGFDDEIDDEADIDDDDMLLIPDWVFEDEEAQKKLGIRIVEKAEKRTTDKECDDSCDKAEKTAGKHLFNAAVLLNEACDLLKSVYADD